MFSFHKIRGQHFVVITNQKCKKKVHQFSNNCFSFISIPHTTTRSTVVIATSVNKHLLILFVYRFSNWEHGMPVQWSSIERSVHAEFLQSILPFLLNAFFLVFPYRTLWTVLSSNILNRLAGSIMYTILSN